jgi:hypothetical protein
MWGDKWGQFFWAGGALSVPAVGFWGAMLLGAALAVVGLRLVRNGRRRTLGVIAVAIAILAPITARAVTLITFTNGTVADANQVNANFAALNPVIGFNEMISLPAIGGTFDLLSPTFVTPRAMTCTVSIESSFLVPSSSPVGGTYVRAVKSENGTLGYAFAPPQNGIAGTGYAFTAGGANAWVAEQTRVFTVASGATVAFGCESVANGDFTAAHNTLCVVVYHCI